MWSPATGEIVSQMRSTAHGAADCDVGKATFYGVVDNQGLDASVAVDLIFVDSGNGEILREAVVGLQPQESQLLGPYLVDISDWIGSLEVSIDEDDIETECDETNNAWDVGAVVCD